MDYVVIAYDWAEHEEPDYVGEFDVLELAEEVQLERALLFPGSIAILGERVNDETVRVLTIGCNLRDVEMPRTKVSYNRWVRDGKPDFFEWLKNYGGDT